MFFLGETIPVSPYEHDWIPTAGSIIICILTALFSWWKNRPKHTNDQFKTFMDESSEFREEMRGERSKLKNDLLELEKERSELEKKTESYKEKIHEYTEMLKKQKSDFDVITSQLIELKENRKYKIIIDNLPHIIWTANGEGNVDFYNQRAYQYSNMPYESGADLKFVQIFHPDDVEEFLKVWTESVKTGKPYFFEFRLRRYDGMYRWCIGRGIPMINGNGRIISWVGSVTDIHDYKTGIISHRGIGDENRNPVK